MSLTYGYDLNDGDELMAAPIQTAEILSRVLLTWSGISKSPPILYGSLRCHCHVGCLTAILSAAHSLMGYEPLIRRGRELSDEMKNKPIEFEKKAMVRGSRAPCHSLWLIML